MKISSIKRYVKSPKKIIRTLGAHGRFKWIPSETYLKLVYWCETGKKLNLSDPKEFNEKLQWMKIYDRRPEYSIYVDKYAVRSYISETIGEHFLIPLIGVYDNVEEINWDFLPDQFVLKCTHGSHCNIICTDKSNFDIIEAEKMLKRWMNKSWYWFGREWPYKNVKPRIICETYMGDLVGVPNDYKIMCFKGEPKIIQIHKKVNNLPPTIDYYDMTGDLLPFRKKGFGNSDTLKVEVEKLKKMIELARILAKDSLYLRTDFYLVNEKIYFGELTFFDSSGFIDFEPEESNYFLGEMIRLD